MDFNICSFVCLSKILVFQVVFILSAEWLTSRIALGCALRVQGVHPVLHRSETLTLVTKAQISQADLSELLSQWRKVSFDTPAEIPSQSLNLIMKSPEKPPLISQTAN